MSGDHWLAELLDWFAEVEQYIPGANSWVGELLLGKVPEAKGELLFELADAWAAAQQRMGTFSEDIATAADPIFEGWGGDGAPVKFRENWDRFAQEVQSAVDGFSGMQEASSGFALEVETEKFMVALNLLMLAISLIVIIATAVISLGTSSAGVGPAFAIARQAIAAAARKALTNILNLAKALARLEFKKILEGIAARSAADRIAGQVFKNVISKEMKNALAQGLDKAAQKALVRGALQMRRELADQLAKQLGEKFAGKVVEGGLERVAAHELDNIVAREVVSGVTRGALQNAIGHQLETTLGKELLRYFTPRVLMGAGFMGGQNLLVQGVEVAVGDRANVNFGDVAMSAAQGAVMGGLMGGHSVVGHMASGAGAGAAAAALSDGVQVLSGHGDKVHWGADLLNGAASGAAFGGVFGMQNGLGGFKESFASFENLKIGQDTHLLLDGGENGGMRLTVDLARGAGDARPDLHLSSDLGGLTHGTSGGKDLWLDAKGNVLDRQHVTGLGDSRLADIANGSRTAAPHDLARGGDGGGGGGGGGRQVAAPGDVRGGDPRTTAPVRPDEPRSGTPSTSMSRDGVLSRSTTEPTRTETTRTETTRTDTTHTDTTHTDGSHTDTTRAGDSHTGSTRAADTHETSPRPVDETRSTDGSTATKPHTEDRSTPVPVDEGPVRQADAQQARPTDSIPAADRSGPSSPPADQSRIAGDPRGGETVRTEDAHRLTGGRDLSTVDRSTLDRVLSEPERYDPSVVKAVQDHVARLDSEGAHRSLSDADVRREPQRTETQRTETTVKTDDRSATTAREHRGDTPGRADQRHPETTGTPPESRHVESPDHPGQDMFTGGSIRPVDEVKAWDWADRAYDLFRTSDADIADIAANLASVERPSGAVGFRPGEIGQIKQHLMVEEHLLDDYDGGLVRKRFDADPDIAEAWVRLREGQHLPEDLVLLEHELTESNYLSEHPGATYREAHEFANQSYDWAKIRPGRTGEDLGTSWGQERRDGNTGGLPDGPGRQTGGRVHFRISGDEPSPGDPQGLHGGQTAGGEPGQGLRGGPRDDPAGLSQSGGLAEAGVVRGVDSLPETGERVPLRMVPVPEVPLGEHIAQLPEAVDVAADTHVRGLLGADTGHLSPLDPPPPDTPYRASIGPGDKVLTLHYPDGFSIDVAHHVVGDLPPGRAIVVLPELTRDAQGWHQTGPAHIVLPDHLPVDGSLHGGVVGRELTGAWQGLYHELHDVLSPTATSTDGAGSLTRATTDLPAARDGGETGLWGEPDPHLPVVALDQARFVDTVPVEPPTPHAPTPESVRAVLDGGKVPDRLASWVQEHLATTDEHGNLVPKSAEEIDTTLARLRQEALDTVTGPSAEHVAPQTAHAEHPGRPGTDRATPADHTGPSPVDRPVPSTPAVEYPPQRLAALPREPYSFRPENHLTAADLAEAKLTVRDGVVYDAHGQRFDSRTVHPDGQVLYVMDGEGNLYVASPGEYSHGSFRTDAPIAGAGRLVVHDGTVLYLDGASRDFAPPREYVQQVVDVLRGAGLDLTDRVLYPEDRMVHEPSRLGQEAIDTVVDQIALRLDDPGRNPIVRGIEGLPDHRVRLELRDLPPVEVDLSHLVSSLADRGMRDGQLHDAVATWLDHKLAAAVADRVGDSGPHGLHRPAAEHGLTDPVQRATQRVSTEWTTTAEGDHAVVVHPSRGRPIVFRLEPTDRGAVAELPSTRPDVHEAQVGGVRAVEVRVSADILADPARRDLLIGRALEAHAVEVRNTRTGLAGVVHRMMNGLHRQEDVLGPEATGHKLTMADEQRIAELRVLTDAYQSAAPGSRAVIAREILDQSDRMFKGPGKPNSFIQRMAVSDRLPGYDDLVRSAERYRGSDLSHLDGGFLDRVAFDPQYRDATTLAGLVPEGRSGELPHTGDVGHPIDLGRPVDPTHVPADHPVLRVEPVDGGRGWVSEIPTDLADRAAAHDPVAVDTLVRHVEGVLHEAADPGRWVDGRPPRIELRTEHGIDAQLARQLEHIRTPFEHHDAAGHPVPRPRVEVTGPRTHGYLPKIELVPEIREQDIRDGVPYFTAQERAPLEVAFVDGLAYDQSGLPLHGQYVFVTEPHTMRTYAMEYGEEGRIGAKHASFLAGGDILSAGEFQAEHGRVLWLDNRSGHYFPIADHVWLQRELFAEHGLDVSTMDVRVLGPERTPFSIARGENAFRAALEELRQPGELDGVQRIEHVPFSEGARQVEPGATGGVLRVFGTDGRVVEVDGAGVVDYLTVPRPAGADAGHFSADRQIFVHDRELARQASDLLRQRIESALGDEPRGVEPTGPGPDGPHRTLPSSLVNLDRVLSGSLDARPLLDGGSHLGEPRLAGDRTAAVTAVRAVSDRQIHTEVDAAGLPADRADALKAELISRRDEMIARYEQPPGAELRQRLQDATAPYVRPDTPPKQLYDALREEAFRKGDSSSSTGFTVQEAARLVDEGIAAEHGLPGEHRYERLIDDWLATPEGRAYHDGLVRLDVAAQHGVPLPEDSAHFTALSEADAYDAHLRQGGDWPAAQREALDRYVDGRTYTVDSYLSSDGHTGHDGRLDAYRIQSSMRAAPHDMLLHGSVTARDLGLSDRAGLAGLVGDTVPVKSFLHTSVDALGTREGQLRLEIEAPEGTRMAWLGAVGEGHGGELLLAAGTEVRVLDVNRIGTDRYVLRVRVTGQEDPPALAGRLLDEPSGHTEVPPVERPVPDELGYQSGHIYDVLSGNGGSPERVQPHLTEDQAPHSGDGHSGDGHSGDGHSGDRRPGDHDLYAARDARTNLDVLHNGGDIPLTLESVAHVADLIGVDLRGVRVELVTGAEEIRYLDARGLSAYTPVEQGGREIRLGPASFADGETLAATLAHEHTHVEQLRSGVEVTTQTRAGLEDAAYASEGPALDRFRARLGGGGHDGDGAVLGGDGLRSAATQRPAGVGEGAGGRDLAGHDPLGRGDQGHYDGTGGGVREPDRAAYRPDDAAAGAHGTDTGARGARPDERDLTRPIGGDPNQPAGRGEIRPGLDFPTADPPRPEGMPHDPNAAFGTLHEQCSSIADEQLHLAESLAGDGKYWFAKVYHNVTTYELRMIDEGRYTYPIMKMQEVVAFHETYHANMDAWLHGRLGEVEPNWRLAFQAAEQAGGRWHPLPTLEVMDALLPSMQAHIRFDLPRAIASVYEHFYAESGIPFDAFKPDFDRMQPVFDDASAALRPEIAERTFFGDPGQYGFVQDHGFKFIFDVPRERLHAWEKAAWIVSGHEAGITDQAGMQRRLDAYSRTYHPFSGRGDFKIGGTRATEYDWNHQPGMGGPPEGVIHAAAVPGGHFNGVGAEPSLAHRAELLGAVPDAMARAVGGHDGLGLHDLGAGRFEVRPEDGRSFTVRVETRWHGFDAAAESHLNHDTGEHVIHLSDQLPVEHVERALAHEIGEIVEDRARYLRGEPATLPDALRPGEFAPDSRLTPHDAGRIQELRVLGRSLDELPAREHRTPEQDLRYQSLHREGLALVEHLGLRDDTAGAVQRRELVLARLDPAGRADVQRLLEDAGRAEHAMSPAERAVLEDVRARAAIDQDRLASWHVLGIDPDPPANVPHPWPVDPVSGHVIQGRDLEFLGFTREQVEAWMAREAPLGMTPETYREWRISLLDALRRDGVSPSAVDIRMRGSGSDFFSGVHKKLPTPQELAGHPEALRRLTQWLGDGADRPTSRPFDSMFKLGLEEPSDFDLNISSGEMFERARAQWDPAKYEGALSKDHGYLNKRLVRSEFPHLYRWADEWSARTGRDMSYAVFDGSGPKDRSNIGFHVHFQETDWIVQRPVAEAEHSPATATVVHEAGQ
jgi:hypothetical protein